MEGTYRRESGVESGERRVLHYEIGHTRRGCAIHLSNDAHLMIVFYGGKQQNSMLVFLYESNYFDLLNYTEALTTFLREHTIVVEREGRVVLH